MIDSWQKILDANERCRKRRRQRLKANRQCTNCTAPLPEGTTICLCPACRAKDNAKTRERYWKRRNAGLCVDCGEPVKNGMARCFRCAVYATERDAILRIAVIESIAHEVRGDLDRRAQHIKGMRRDMALLENLATRIFDRFFETIEPEQQRAFRNQLSQYSYVIGAKKPFDKDRRNMNDYGIWLSHETINLMLEAIEDHCITCDDDGASCPLRKAMDTLGTDVEHVDGCGYREMQFAAANRRRMAHESK